jgi:hemolysin-activating ACP:hemolysin acyltransferase
MQIALKTVTDLWLGLGLAAHYTARRAPFATFPAGDLIRTLSAQIQRKHALFAFDTSTKPAKLVGYVGWALYHAEDAARFAADGKTLTCELADGGDVLWILTAAADSRAVFVSLAGGIRRAYPGHRLMAVRYKRGRRVILQRPPLTAKTERGKTKP